MNKKSSQSTAEVTIALEEISPPVANELLRGNAHNRHIRQSRVDQYARDMKAGKWLPVGEPIHIDPKGTIGNGQHRLLAIVQSGKTVTIPVIRGLALGAQDVTDQGLKRRFSDVLKLHYDEQNVSTLAAAIRQLHIYRVTCQLGTTGGGLAATTPSIAELLRTYQRNRRISESIAWASRLKNGGIRISPGIATALHFIFSEINAEDADEFFSRLADGGNLSEGDPIWLTRRRLIGPDRPQWPKAQAALLIKAFNLWRRGEAVDSKQGLRWRSGGAKPEPFPEVIREAA